MTFNYIERKRLIQNLKEEQAVLRKKLDIVTQYLKYEIDARNRRY